MLRESFIAKETMISHQISNLINTPIEQNFERLARMAKRMFDVPVIVVGLFDEKRKSVKPVVALDFSDFNLYQPFFTDFVSDEILVVEDALKNDRFKNHPLIEKDPLIRFIVICPIFEKNGKKIGSLILIDYKPRSLSLSDLMSLNEIVKLIETEICTFSLSKAQKLLLHEISNKSKAQYIDAKTRAWNYETSRKILQYQIKDSLADQVSFGFAYIDIDNLKDINTKYGKQFGDEVLALTAKTILRSCRDEDTISRGKNEDFRVIIHAQTPEHVKLVLDRIKTNLDQIEIKSSTGILRYNVTIGATMFTEQVGNEDNLIQNAEMALLKGKRLGRNRIEFI